MGEDADKKKKKKKGEKMRVDLRPVVLWGRGKKRRRERVLPCVLIYRDLGATGKEKGRGGSGEDAGPLAGVASTVEQGGGKGGGTCPPLSLHARQREKKREGLWGAK